LCKNVMSSEERVADAEQYYAMALSPATPHTVGERDPDVCCHPHESWRVCCGPTKKAKTKQEKKTLNEAIEHPANRRDGPGEKPLALRSRRLDGLPGLRTVRHGGTPNSRFSF